MSRRDEALAVIERNIRTHGYHVYVVSGGPTPRWVYTIGLSKRLGCELILAGSAALSKESVLGLLEDLSCGGPWQQARKFADGRGEFTLAPVSEAWGVKLLLGAYDFYAMPVPALQIVPLGELATIDVPALAEPPVPGRPTAWRWLVEPWPYPDVSPKSTAMVDGRVLRGAAPTEVARWEEDYWEVFAGPGDQVSKDDARLLPLGALLGRDPSLEVLTTLAVGQGRWRNGGGEAWRVMGRA